MILVTRTKKNNRSRGFGLKNKKTRDYKMKKILIVNQDITNF